MLASTILQSISALFVLLTIICFGVWLSRKRYFDLPSSRATVSKLVNTSIPCFLFYSVISKFSHDELLNLLTFAGVPFLTVAINYFISLLFIRLGWVRPHLKGTFIAAFSAATVLFVGVPLVSTMYGSDGIPYLLVYFFANCVFIWTVGLFNIQVDGVRKGTGVAPKIISLKGLRMLLSPPLLAFLLGLVVVLSSITVPNFIQVSTRYLGQLTTPLALIFVGITIHQIGVEKLRKMPREVWLVLLSCFVIRPLVMYLCTMSLDMDPLMRKCFILASALPVSSVIAVLSKGYGGDEEFASEAIGASTVGMIVVLPFLLIAVNLI
ncbi:AEC family transporter [Turicimonas muris]|uniref:Transporter n=3 Tax=Turicimonas muris TaxID=1796652 RepID=A0A227KIX4_9BURK|nr:AEC family transporter [Turicimonas muris]ANU67098.1 transporter [Burkholderiales bacterium YL45]OXE47723.1 transporter [Turicimonas muris]QQQ95951.1 AEC family transporter [Turicimonas muris]